ncbi:MAG: glycosyl hydrolase 115 family protein, partial [Muribaculaceae bacterium]|nr:glycosyl hydrolase 115 family protein [Muribaculaceae bacterium]
MKLKYFILIYILLFTNVFLSAAPTKSNYIISEGGKSIPVVVDRTDWKGVIRAAGDLADDIGKVTGTPSELFIFDPGKRKGIKGKRILVGTIGKSPHIDRWIETGRLNVDSVKGQWESYVIDVIDDDLVIAGSDKRGTIYGIYELSRLMGVSPWYYWADVPVPHKDKVVYSEGRLVQPSPKVKYRGIFINDEWPSFGGWCVNSFGGINSKAYAHMFELLLRLKANYLWPAMWDTAFNEDDEECPRLADEYGIVMGTSHHEPMMRAHKEYTRRRDSIGLWDYSKNPERLDEFFRYGIERNKNYDNLITIGMRGDGDVAMGTGNDEDNMATLKDVINSQRRIIADIYGKPDSVPQLWAIFTEVQRYYDAGFTVPDDVTLLFCDNNWGYIRRTAPAEDRDRKGGFGMYYHIDMNGGPWNDRWVNTSPLPKLREQLNLAYQSGIDRIWIINVGDLKPKELPIDFIMDYAWNPDAIQPGDEAKWLREWSASTFGEEVADDVADILAKYPKYNLWRKAEVQTAGLFSVENYDEAARLDSLWQQLADKAESIKDKIAPEAQDAYFQLVYYPTVASAGVARLYLAAEQNRHYAKRNDTRANLYADRVKQLFARDAELTAYYNDTLANGKWKGMMQDNHIGYTMWSMPEKNIMPEVVYVNDDYSSVASSEVTPAADANLNSASAVNAITEYSNSATTPITEYSIPAIKYDRKTAGEGAEWILLPDLGRGAGCMGINNVTAPSASLAKPGPALEYDLQLPANDSVKIAIGILPTQDINPVRGLRLALQLDNGEIKILDARRGLVDTFGEYTPENLKRSKKLKPLPAPGKMALNGAGKHMRNEIFDNLRWLDITLPLSTTSLSPTSTLSTSKESLTSTIAIPTSTHTLRIMMIDPEIVIETIVV